MKHIGNQIAVTIHKRKSFLRCVFSFLLKRNTIWILFFLAGHYHVFAQPFDPPIRNCRVNYTKDSLQCTDFKIKMELTDTININAIELWVGSKPAASDILSYEFITDITTGLPAGLAYQRNGKSLELLIGVVPRKSAYYCRIRTKNHLNEYSSYYKLMAN